MNTQITVHSHNGTLHNNEKLISFNDMHESCKVEQKKLDSKENILWSTFIEFKTQSNGISLWLGIALVQGWEETWRGLLHVGNVLSFLWVLVMWICLVDENSKNCAYALCIFCVYVNMNFLEGFFKTWATMSKGHRSKPEKVPN